MRHNPSTVVVLAGPAPAEVLAAVGRSMNVALIRPAETRPAETRPAPTRPAPTRPEDSADSGRPGLEAAAGALQRAGRATAPYALVPADPLAALAASWREMWDVSRQAGPAGFELEAARVLTAWRAGRFELPDYYLVLAGDTGEHGPDFHLGPLRSARAHRVVPVAETEPAQQAAAVLHALGSLRHGPWWPGLDEVIETARRFYPDSLAEQSAALAADPPRRS